MKMPATERRCKPVHRHCARLVAPVSSAVDLPLDKSPNPDQRGAGGSGYGMIDERHVNALVIHTTHKELLMSRCSSGGGGDGGSCGGG
mgnify:CR=1 FL=1